MYIDEKRLEIQMDCLKIWSAKTSGRGIISLPPRMGKTMVGGLAIQNHSKKFQDYNILIIVTSDIIRSQWETTLQELGCNRERILILTKTEIINKVLDLINKEFTLTIIDEIHKFLTPKGIEILKLKNIKTKFILGLTGTFVKELEYYFPLAISISEEQAIKNGWVSAYKEYNIGVDLTEEEKALYSKYTEYIQTVLNIFKGSLKALCDYQPMVDYRKAFKDDFDLLISCASGKVLPNGKYIEASLVRNEIAYARGWSKDFEHNEINNEIDKWFNPNNLAEHATVFNDIVRKRNEIINFCSAKINTALEIVFKFKEHKIISFSQSTKFADELANKINSATIIPEVVVYHSKLKSIPIINPETNDYYRYKTGIRKGEIKLFGKDSLKSMAIDGMKNGTYRVLSTVESLNEGLNIPDLTIAIISSGDCNPIVDYQRKSRTKTIDPNNPNKLAYIFNIYIKPFMLNDTLVTSRDLAKLKLRQKNEEVIWIDSIDDIE